MSKTWVAVTDGEEGAKGEIKSTTALRLLEFSVLLAVKNSQEKAGNKVKGYTKKVIFTEWLIQPLTRWSFNLVRRMCLLEKKRQRGHYVKIWGDSTAWDSAKGICKKEEVQRAVAKKAVAVICASDTGIGGNLDSSGTTCSPPYWGKNCHFCGTNFWVKKRSAHREKSLAQTDRMIAFQISVCWWTRAEPRRQVLVRVPIPSLEALPRRTGIVHRHKPVTNLLPVPVCPLVKRGPPFKELVLQIIN